ncbi:recombination directionality factor [Kitasatospora purpeofusca]|uniref:recombination directionality factor n=1 Tax=Kitasatospora purpeofusca TaxID=67352 RepID=UPI0037F9F1BA
MRTQIWDTDPDAKPKPRQTFSDDLAFRFRAGRMLNDRPVTLAHWRVTTGDPEVADAIAQLMGGKPEEWETSKEDFLEVLTTSESVKVVINGVKDIDSRFVLWGRSGGPIHECDGVNFLSPEEDAGTPCGCPALLADRKAQSRSGRGPSPQTKITFRLAEDYHLGKGQLTSTSWELVKVLHEIDDALDSVSGEALCSLTLELVEFTTSSGQAVSFRKPVIKVLKAYNEAIADDPHTDES